MRRLAAAVAADVLSAVAAMLDLTAQHLSDYVRRTPDDHA